MLSKRLFIPSYGIIDNKQVPLNTAELLGKQAKHVDKYHYLLHYLLSARAFDRRIEVTDYIPVNHKIFDKYVNTRHSAEVIKFWLQQGVIEREVSASGKKVYTVGEKSIGYRFTEAYRKSKVIEVGYVDEKFEAKVAHLTEETRNGFIDLKVKANAFISFNLRELRINGLDAQLDINRYLAAGDFSLEEANIATVRVNAIEKKDFFCIRDNVGHRIHHNYAVLNSVLREHCYIESGEQLVNIDVTNSQPVILCVLLKKHFTQLPADVLEYIQLCESGKFYEALAEKLGIDISSKLARASFKQMLFRTIFYGRNQAAEKYDEWHLFTERFPNVAAFITDYKKKDYTALSIALQRIESEIVIEGVVSRIAHNHSPENFFALTIHDSITTTADKAEYVLDLLKNEFALRGINPAFNIEEIN